MVVSSVARLIIKRLAKWSACHTSHVYDWALEDSEEDQPIAWGLGSNVNGCVSQR